MYCVFDGHGPAGELVSEFVMLRLPAILEEQAVAHPSCFSDEEMEQTLISTFEAVDAELGCVCCSFLVGATWLFRAAGAGHCVRVRAGVWML